MGSLKSLLPFLKKYKAKLGLSIIFNLLTALFTLISIPLVIPFFQILFGVNISGYSPSSDFLDLESNLNYYFSRLIAISDRHTALTFVCLVLVTFVFLRNLFRYLTSFFLIPVRNGLVRDLRNELMRAYASLPFSYLKSQRKGDLLAISSSDVVEVEWSVIRMMELLFKSPIVILGSLILMFWINAKLSIIALVLMAVIGIVLGALSKNLKKKSAETQSLLGRLNSQVDDLLSGFKIVKAYGAESFFKSLYAKKNQQHYKKNNRILWRRDLASPLSELLGVILVIILIWYGAQQVLASDMRPETFFAFVIAFYNVIEPSKTLSSAYYNVQKGLASMDRITNVINIAKHDKSSESSKVVQDNWKEISFENLSFSFDLQTVLRDLNMTLKRGTTTAIVGKSGEGKSTVVDLLMRLYAPDEGEIRIDKQNIKYFTKLSYDSLFGLVTQEPILYNFSVKENILMGRSWNEHQFVKALAIAKATDFVNKKIEGINSEAGDQGTAFSVGERQRIAIARALYNDPPILIIDEATTSLDSQAESEVIDALTAAMKNKTTLIISHNFNLVKNADIIFVVDKGMIVKSGRHDELMKQPGIYKDLLSYQHG